MVKKYLGLDLGTKTLGIAYNDALGFVHGLETFRFDRNQYIVARKHVIELCEKMMIKEIAIGLPLHLSGQMSEMANNVMRFREDLLKDCPSLVINTVDERLTSVTANRSISEQGMNHKQRKESVDRIAACIILDTYVRMKERK
jgi:putative Holliday junction resolvase